MVNILEGLNPQQQEAVLYDGGPLLVLAGAGSGKTKTLTHKIANLLSSGLQENQILALTFTNKAAKEMRERIANLIGVNNNYYFMPYMGTFHSISVKILRIDGANIGVDKNFVIYDESDKLSTIKRILKNNQIDEKLYAPKTITSIISDAKNKGMNAREYGQYVQTPIQKISFQVMGEYEQELRKASALDFDDLILKTLNLISSDKTTRGKWQNQFRYILVDEYQDTNQAQYQLIKLLVNDEKRICVVGDDWQSVYSWRGADYTNILNFERDFKDAKTIKLEQNYRSTGNILDAAGKVIANNKNKAEKKLWTASGPGEDIEILQASNEAHEADMLAAKIKDIKFSGSSLNQIAILYRTNAQSRSVEESLMRNAIAYQLIGGTRFYDRKEVKDILSYLKLIYQKDDMASFMRAINVPSRGLGKVSLDNFVAWVSSRNLSLSQGLEIISGKRILDSADEAPGLFPGEATIDTSGPRLTPKAKAAITQFYELINSLNEQKDGSEVYQIIELIISATSYKNYLKLTDKNWEERLENINELVNVAKQYSGYSLNDFIEATALQTAGEEGLTTPTEETVKLMTLHASKGLEFDTVFMIGMEESIFPSSRSLSEQDQLEEERRLCYVGMTRARKKLYLAFATKRMLWGTSNFNMPSRFLEESGVYDPSDYKQPLAFSGSAGIYHQKDAKPADPNAFFAAASFEPDLPKLNIGDKVKHQLFGIGFVESVENSDALIAFSSGKKKLNLEYAPLEKL